MRKIFKSILVLALFGLPGVSYAFINEEIESQRVGVYELVEVTSEDLDRPLCDAFLKNLKQFENRDFSMCDFQIAQNMKDVFQHISWKEMPWTDENIALYKKIRWEGYNEFIGEKDRERRWREELKQIKGGKAALYAIITDILHKDGRTNTLWRFVYEKDCPADLTTTRGTHYILNAEGTELDRESYPFSPVNHKGGNKLGFSFYYKNNQLVLYKAGRLFKDNYLNADFEIYLWSVGSMPEYNSYGQKIGPSVSVGPRCLYKFTKFRKEN